MGKIIHNHELTQRYSIIIISSKITQRELELYKIIIMGPLCINIFNFSDKSKLLMIKLYNNKMSKLKFYGLRVYKGYFSRCNETKLSNRKINL